MCNRTDCAGSWAGAMACAVCRERDMSEMKLNDAELARLEELAGKATPGKWSTTDYTGPDVLITAMLEGIPYSVWNRGTNARKEDLEYIAAACNMAPVLVAEVRKLRDRVEALEKTKKHLSETARVLAEQVGNGNLGKIQDALDYAHYKASEREAMK